MSNALVLGAALACLCARTARSEPLALPALGPAQDGAREAQPGRGRGWAPRTLRFQPGKGQGPHTLRQPLGDMANGVITPLAFKAEQASLQADQLLQELARLEDLLQQTREAQKAMPYMLRVMKQGLKERIVDPSERDAALQSLKDLEDQVARARKDAKSLGKDYDDLKSQAAATIAALDRLPGGRLQTGFSPSTMEASLEKLLDDQASQWEWLVDIKGWAWTLRGETVRVLGKFGEGARRYSGRRGRPPFAYSRSMTQQGPAGVMLGSWSTKEDKTPYWEFGVTHRFGLTPGSVGPGQITLGSWQPYNISGSLGYLPGSFVPPTAGLPGVSGGVDPNVSCKIRCTKEVAWRLMASLWPGRPGHTIALVHHTITLERHTLPLVWHTLPLVWHTIPLEHHVIPLPVAGGSGASESGPGML